MSLFRSIGSLPRQTRLTMQLSVVLLFAIGFQVSATGISAQTSVSYSGKDVPLEQVFAAVKKQTGYTFVYYTETLQGTHKVTMDVRNLPIERFLETCLKDEPVTYKIIGQTVVITKREKESAVLEDKSVINAEGLTIEIKGRIINKQGEPLGNANIVIMGSNKGTITDANGQFTIKNVAQSDVLLISFVGYKSQSVKIGMRTNDNMVLVLEEANSSLDETVVQAYGTTSRRLSVGNIARVTSTDIEKQPVMNPLQAMQGFVPGLVVTQTSGFSSAPFKVEIRGRNSLNNAFTSDPLYIIDGVPLTILEVGGNSLYSTGSTGFIQNGLVGPARGQSPLFSINPSDIESIEVLKDADATAIYGSRASNGVILITTKKGKAGATKFNIKVTQGVSKVGNYYDMMNTQQYLAMRHEALKNDGTVPTAGNAPDLLVWDTTRYTNWQKQIWGGAGRNTDAQVSLTGGNAQTSFRIGAGYTDNKNILTTTGGDQRGGVSLSMIHRSVNTRWSVSLSAGYSFTKSNMTYLPANAALLAPDAPAIFNNKGNLNYAGWGPLEANFPFASLLQTYTDKGDLLNSNLTINFEIIKGLTFRTSLGYNDAINNQVRLFPIASLDPVTAPKGTAQFGNNSNKGYIIEPQLEYNSFISKGKLNVLAGASSQYTTTDGILTQGSGYTSDLLLTSITTAPTKTSSEFYGQYKYAAIFGRVNYNWENKYILNLNARRDGSSRFGPGKQFGNFGSAGIAWVISEEKWLKDNIAFLSFAKLRATYGITGSDVVGDYQYLTRWGASLATTYNGTTSLLPTQHSNDKFQWQVNKKLETGVDLGFFKDRLNLSVVYYRNQCGNQLVNIVIPAYTGFGTVTGNWPAVVRNEGWEVTANGKIIDSKDFSWTIDANIAINKNKLVSYPGLAQSPYANSLVIGQPVNLRFLLHSTGVNPQTGLATFEDKNKDGIISPTYNSPASDFYTYNLSPKYSGGLGSSFRYKSWQLGIRIYFIKQIGTNALSGQYPGIFSSNALSNLPVSVLSKRWQKPGDISSLPRLTATATDPSFNNFYNLSDGVYTDASFARLSNLSLSYSLPVQYIKRIGMQNCNVFINAQNLFTLTKYQGADPETQTIGTLPTPRIIVGGISFNF
ncbi:MAG TPA: SusC/RagA family TonB-linked outer membrane protein [Puia sp.]|jgi:TonB-linked SusC/RagA family outer membrane protein